jgi:DNA-binding response OmpR family regulator
MTNRKILVADDNANIRKVVKMGFESLGYTVIAAEDGRVALEKIRAEHPDLVILDVMMPEKSGYDVCSEMKADAGLRTIPVVMLTAKNLEEDQYWGRELGADEYITKPYDPEELERTVEKIFALRERGESYHPLTKLPLWAAIRHEIEQRRGARAQFVVLGCSFEPVAFEIYQMKYGNIKADHVTLQTSRLIQEAARRIAGDRAFVGHTGDNVFYLVIPPGTAEELRDAINREFAAAVRLYYRDDDALRGYVLKPCAGEADECIPLLSLEWKVVTPE